MYCVFKDLIFKKTKFAAVVNKTETNVLIFIRYATVSKHILHSHLKKIRHKVGSPQHLCKNCAFIQTVFNVRYDKLLPI